VGKENLVDIMCIGVQKGSTSWLHHVINSHPKAQAFKRNPKTSTNKEAHFWDWNYHEGIEWYKNLMTVDENKLSLDFSPEYAFVGEDKIKICKNLSPSAKIFYVLREPVKVKMQNINWNTTNILKRLFKNLKLYLTQNTIEITKDGTNIIRTSIL